MKARHEVAATLADAPTIDLDEAFWEKARIVQTPPRRLSLALEIRQKAG
jgi:hypothetical protein